MGFCGTCGAHAIDCDCGVPPRKIVVLYHNDKDGEGSAYVTWLQFKNTAEYIPVSYGRPTPKIPNDSDVYIVDFSYSRNELLTLADRMNRVVVLDHHKTAEDNLKGLNHPNLTVKFDMSKAGVGVTWDYFFDALPIPMPNLLKFIQDRDLWKFEFPETKAVREYLCTMPYDPEVWHKIVCNPLEPIVEIGNHIVAARDQAVKVIVGQSYESELDGLKTRVVNSSIYQSEVGNKMLEKYPKVNFVVIYSDVGKDLRICSLRSRGDFDVSEIAKKHGGGGHSAAAGFRVNYKTKATDVG